MLKKNLSQTKAEQLPLGEGAGISGGKEHKSYFSKDIWGALVNAYGGRPSNSAKSDGEKGVAFLQISK